MQYLQVALLQKGRHLSLENMLNVGYVDVVEVRRLSLRCCFELRLLVG